MLAAAGALGARTGGPEPSTSRGAAVNARTHIAVGHQTAPVFYVIVTARHRPPAAAGRRRGPPAALESALAGIGFPEFLY